MRKIVITGGHLTPALSAIAELKRRGEKEWQIYYFGRRYSFEGKSITSEESKIVPSTGATFIPINAGRWQRKITFYTLFSLLRVPLGFLEAFKNLILIKPEVILSFGSYVSTPVVVAGWLMGIPVVSHEQTVCSGLANKINSFFSSLIAVSYPESLASFPQKKTILTGNLIRKEIFQSKTDFFTKKIALQKNKTRLPLIYITGGVQGASAINQVVVQNLPKLLEKYLLIHQTGSLDYQNIFQTAKSLKNKEKENYFLKNYVPTEEIGWIFKNCDLVVSRSGANICYDLGVLGKPAILIPLPFASQDEQFKNARRLKELGLAEILLQKDLNFENLFKLISAMTERLDFYKPKVDQLKTFLKDGDIKLIDEIYGLLQKKEK